MNSQDEIYQKLIDQHDRFYRIAYSYVRNEQDAMDIVQEVAYKAIKNNRKIKEPEYAETWLFRVTINTSVDFLRKRKHEEIGLPLKEEARNDDYKQLYVMDMLSRLDEKSRAVILLHIMEDKTFQQVAEITGDNINTVKTMFYKALKTLKLQLSEEAEVCQ